MSVGRITTILATLSGGPRADRVVPPSGHTATLTTLTAAAMAFLAVFALALSLATGRLADRWAGGLAATATVRIAAPPEQMAAQTQKVLDVLSTTPGVTSARALGGDEIKALLEPWLGPDLPVDTLPLPQLVELTESANGIDSQGLEMRLKAEAPGAILDDHMRWRQPLIASAERIRLLGLLSLLLIGGASAAMITLATQASLAANGQVVRTLRLIGARDSYIARAFVRRFTLRALIGALAGCLAGMVAVALLPPAADEGGFLTGLGFAGLEWAWPLAIPPVAALVALLSTRAAAFRSLRSVR